MPALRRPLVLLVCVVGGAAVAAQNSTRKIRPEPSAAAGRAGKAVQWRADLAAALDEARREGKPVFWYVPTVPGSPMDRKAEIDRYMMAGPFSWPDTVRWLNERFVPVKAVPAPEEARERGLVRGKFIEPGFVVLDAEGGERLRCDRVATHAPDWWRARLSHALAEELPDARPAAMVEALAAYGRDDFGAALAALDELARGEGDVAAQATFLRGVVAARQGDHAACERAWDELRARFPEHMLASKVAAEREGFGPFRRGFEDFRPLPEAVLAGATASTQAPPGAYGKAEAIARSLRFLVEQQEGDGLYRDSTYDFGGTDSLPNVHLAITALAGEALFAHRARAPEALRARIDGALARIDACLADDRLLAAEDRDEIAWAHAYRLRTLCRTMRADEPERARGAARAGELVQALAALQQENGAWFHEYPNPFVIATVLLALADAKDAGVDVPEDVARRGVEALARCRAANGAFPYALTRRPPRNLDVVGAAGRMPLCELALLRWGRSDQEKLAAALEAAFAHHDVMAAVRQYDDHADRHGYGGFFFWFDMQARSEAIAAIEDAGLRARLAARQEAIVLALPEIDGCFVDSHELGRSYGTAMALLCLRE
ncbi:MAG TPA: hypothetical protein VK081_03060 [Planctomycetota bacterium]|nr:hypothetical protein [Planctomycetota bacterium]